MLVYQRVKLLLSGHTPLLDKTVSGQAVSAQPHLPKHSRGTDANPVAIALPQKHQEGSVRHLHGSTAGK